MTNRRLSAQEAHDWGLVSKVVPHGDLLHAVKSLANELKGMPPLSLRAVKEFVNRGIDGYDYACKVFSDLKLTDDAKEGTAAFIEKRKPVFKGK